MKEEVKQISEAVLSHPKTSYLAVAVTNINAWWIDWGSPIVDAVSSIAGLFLVVFLLLLNVEKWKQARRLNNDKADK